MRDGQADVKLRNVESDIGFTHNYQELIFFTISNEFIRYLVPPISNSKYTIYITYVKALTLLGLGLIKIKYVSANFINPRPSLILDNYAEAKVF